MKVAFALEFCLTLPASHRFPMEKYELLPQQLQIEGILKEKDFFRPPPISKQTLQLTHSKQYLKKLYNKKIDRQHMKQIGFPYSKELLKREELITGGTANLCSIARQEGVGFNIAGGTHHASPIQGAGFCIFNDVGVAANHLIQNNSKERVLIIDLDVHQGDGTARIFQNEPQVYTFSMHGANNYPYHKPSSDYDLPLPDSTKDNTYLNLLDKALKKLHNKIQPTFLFYIAGADVINSDQLGKLSLTIDGARQRDKLVFEYASYYNIPVVVTMGGGYSSFLRDIVNVHCNTFRVAQTIYQ